MYYFILYKQIIILKTNILNSFTLINDIFTNETWRLENILCFNV